MLTPEDAVLCGLGRPDAALCEVGRPDVDGVVAAAGLTVFDALGVLDGVDRDVLLEGCLVAVLADEAMVVIGSRPFSANRILPTPVSQQSFV